MAVQPHCLFLKPRFEPKLAKSLLSSAECAVSIMSRTMLCPLVVDTDPLGPTYIPAAEETAKIAAGACAAMIMRMVTDT